MAFENCPSVQRLLSFIPLSVLRLLLQHVIYTARKLYEIYKIGANRIKSKWSFSQLLKWIEFRDPELQKWILADQANTDGPYEVFCVTSNLTCDTFDIILKYTRILSTVLFKEPDIVAKEQGPSQKCLVLEDSQI